MLSNLFFWALLQGDIFEHPHPNIHAHRPSVCLIQAVATDDEDDDSMKAALQKYKMVDARLRRLCERKPSGRLNVPQAIHDQWAQVGKPRDELRALLEAYDFDRDS